MNWTLTCRQFLGSLVLLVGLVSTSLAQNFTSTPPTISPSSNLCTGSTITVTVSTTGGFTAGNVFTVQRSDADGTFPASPVSIGSLTSSPASATTLNISATLGTVAYDTRYRFRVVSSAPSRTSNQTASAFTVGTPEPGGAASFQGCQNSGTLALNATGTTLEWYNSAAANAPVVATGGTYSVPTSTVGTITYYVTQTVNGCKSAKKSVNANIVAAPGSGPGVSGLSAYCPGAGGQLTATGTGTAFRWINLTDNSVQNVATINAPSTTTSYSVSQFNSAGCESPRIVFTATVYPVPGVPTIANANPAYCPADNPGTLTASTNGIGTNIRWNGSGTNNASIAAPTSSANFSVAQVSANGCIGPSLPVNITVYGVPGAPTVPNPNLAYCPESTPSTLGVGTNGAGNSLKWYLPGGGTSTNAPAPPNSTGLYSYSVSQVSSNQCEGARTTINVTVHGNPAAAPTISAQPTYCINARPASLTASGTGLKWYNTSGNFLSDNTVQAPGTSTAYDVRQSNAQGCIGPALRVNATVNGQPGNPGTSNLALCQNETPRTLSATGSNLTWYTQGSNAALSGAPTPSTSQGNSFTIYEVTQTDGNGCVSNRSSLRFDVKPLPSSPGVGTFSVCQNAAPPVLTATGASGSTLNWYLVQGGNDVPQSGTPQLSSGNTGTTTYRVSQSVNGCEGSRATTTFTVFDLPVQPTVGTYNYCQAQAPGSLVATSGSNIRWYNQNGGFLANNTLTPPTNTGIYTYQVSQTDGRNCESTRLAISVQVRPTPAAPGVSSPIFCQGRPAQQLSATGEAGATFAWQSGNGTGLPNAPTPETSNTGQQAFYVTQTNTANCTSTTALLTVTVNAIPALPNFTTPRQYCSGETADLLQASGTALRWYDAQTGGNGSSNAIRPSTSPNPSDASSTRSYFVTQTVASCESERREIQVVTKRKPGLPTNVPAPANVDFCQFRTPPTLSATPEAGASLLWVYDGRDNNGAPVPPNNNATTFNYAVAQNLNGCRSDNAAFTVRVKPTPNRPGITPFPLCLRGPSRPLEPILASGNSVRYYSATDVLLPGAPTLSTEQVGTLSYKVSQVNGDGCESDRADYSIVVNPLPPAPGVAAVQYCRQQTDQPAQNVQAISAQVVGQAPNTRLRFFNSDENEFLTGPPTPSLTRTSDNNYLVTQTDGNGCQSSRSTINVKVVTTETPVISTSLLTYCRLDVAQPIPVTAPTNATLVWFDPNSTTFTQGPGTPAPTPPTREATKGGERYQVYAIGTNGCYSARTSVGLVINTAPTLSLFGSTTVNYGIAAPLRLRFTSQPPYSYSLSDGTTGQALDTIATVRVTPLATTIYQVASVSNVCGVGSSGAPATATVFVNVPTVSTQAITTSNTLCAGTTVRVSYTTTGAFNAGNLFRVQLADTTSKVYNDVPSALNNDNSITATVPASLTGGPYFVRVLATNPSSTSGVNSSVGGQRSTSVLTVRGLPGATLTGTQTIVETYPANLSITFSGDGPWQITYTSSDGQSNTFSTNANPHILTVQPLVLTSYRLVSVSNDCASTSAVSGTAVITVDKLLAVEEVLTSALSLYPVPTQTILTVAIEVPLTTAQPAELQLSDFSGKPVLSRTTTSRLTPLDLSQQPAGIYLLSVQVGDQRAVRKVMKL